MTNKERAEEAIKFVLDYEKKESSGTDIIEDVSSNKEHRGYDIKSGSKMIEVKGIGESWSAYNWQSLYKTERECLRKNPNDFYLYIVKFINTQSSKIEGLYVIPGIDLEREFRIEVETYGIRPVSKKSLMKFLQSQ